MARRAPPNTRVDLLRAAEACFCEQGFEATKIEHITAKAGIAKGAFYSYFASKEECWKQIVDGFLVRMAQAVEFPDDPTDTRNLLQRVQAHDLRVMEFCWENRALLRLLISGSAGATYAYLLDAFANREAKNCEALLGQMVVAGLMRSDLDPTLVSLLVGGAYDRIVRELIRSPTRPDIAAWSREIHRTLMLGLLTDAGRAALVGAEPGGRGQARRGAKGRPTADASDGPKRRPVRRAKSKAVAGNEQNPVEQRR